MAAPYLREKVGVSKRVLYACLSLLEFGHHEIASLHGSQSLFWKILPVFQGLEHWGVHLPLFQLVSLYSVASPFHQGTGLHCPPLATS